MSDTAQVLIGYVRNELAAGDSSIDAETPLLEEDIVDSIGILSLVQFIEDRFEIAVDADDVNLENFATIGAMSHFIDSRR